MRRYVLSFDEIDRAAIDIVGGKGAHLGALSHVDGILVPAGFCVTTDAFMRVIAEAPALDGQLDQLSLLKADERESIRSLSAHIRQVIEGLSIPDDIASAIIDAIVRLGDESAYAVRSSATAEDLPTASFAGQQDTYLNVIGSKAVLEHVSKCWASLFTERAVTYRLRNGFDHRNIRMAVVVQKMVFPKSSGIMFTADPVTGNRKVVSIDASFGLGEALVSGLVNADVYKVRGGAIVDKSIAAKTFAIDAVSGGGTREHSIELEKQQQPSLTDVQAIQLAQIGRKIESHFGSPQDIEWCLVDDEFHVVQSRPITTLFPIPETTDNKNHVYLSVGHQQMMTDPMKPLGLAFWQMTTPRPMGEAAGRLFVDVTQAMAVPASRASMLDVMGKSDPLMRDALQGVIDRGDFIQPLTEEGPVWTAPSSGGGAPVETDPAIVTAMIARSQESIDELRKTIEPMSGSALLDFIQEDIKELRRVQFDPRGLQVIMAGMEAAWWLNEKLQVWLGEKNPADTLTQSVPNNVTSEMGLALLDVADVIRPHPAVVEFLEGAEPGFMDELPHLAGGQQSRDAIQHWLDRYGMRGVGEIDITRPRWSERPTMLLPLILSNVRNFEAGAGERRFEQGRQEALEKERDILSRLRALPDGEEKADETKRMIDRVRTFAGYREYPKYGMVSRYFVYKQALMKEAERLVKAGVIRDKEDIFYLRYDELKDVARTGMVNDDLIRERREAYKSYQALRPPRVLTSDGELLSGAYRREDVPAGALPGTPVSAGLVEGRARVIPSIEGANLEPGDILVTAYTDPSWTPLFVAIDGLVTEVGGLMTHGAVIAREYGLPAVVGVEHATRLIRDGQRIRVHGTEGYVEILS
jgi:pyruvate,water dikinase